MQNPILSALVIVFVSAPACLVGQEPAECPGAVAAMSTLARPDILNDTATSFRQLFACPLSGPPQIARLWSLTGLSQAESEELRYRSRFLLDTRILSTLMSVSRNASRESYVRQAASAATLPYVNRDINADVASLRRAASSSQSSVYSTGAADIRLGGSQPSAASSRDVAQLMSDLATQSQDIALQEIGRAGFRDVFERAPEAVTIPTSAVTLTYMCGNKFRFRSRVAANLILRYDVYGTPTSGQFTVDAPRIGNTQTEMFFFARAKGTVRVFYRTQLLQTKANGGTACS